MIRRLYVEKRGPYAEAARRMATVMAEELGLDGLGGLRILLRYDVEGVADEVWPRVETELLVEPAIEVGSAHVPWPASAWALAIEYLPGQFDQRADSAEQCIRLLDDCDPIVRCATVYVFPEGLDDAARAAVRRYLINPVDSREASHELPQRLRVPAPEPQPVRVLRGFRTADADGLAALHRELGLAMSAADLAFCQRYFIENGRDPTLTEIKLLDTYWSDHCRHTTFLTEITEVEIEEGPYTAPVAAAWQSYLEARQRVHGGKAAQRPICLMDVALIGMRHLRTLGGLQALEESEEVNAASIVVPVEIDGESQEWLVMFKNETHNHPTEIEPFGGAATCLGGAIRDPLSGRSYVYQAMRVTGSADPRKPIAATLPGKLPQRKITVDAAHGYSSYGNQIGLATGMVSEVYHPGYEAKRMEIGAVIAAGPRSAVRRARPQAGDVIVLVGGRTGRDGIGGATGSSKAHTDTALENAAEVQKGDAPTERKLQRLFRDPAVSLLIKRCNDFGAGGVSVAIGELADGLDIDLDAVPLKYAGLDGTEIALSESQERMAVVLGAADVAAFVEAARRENLEAVAVAAVTAERRLRMRWRGEVIVDIARDFIDTNGVRQQARAHIVHPEALEPAALAATEPDVLQRLGAVLADLNVCSQRGLVERFDSSIGSASILHPFGGRAQATPAEAMAALLPVRDGTTSTATLMSFGFHPGLSSCSPFHGAVMAVVESVSRIIASGGALADTYLTFQEYFERLRDEPLRWGKPLAALLGAWVAQRELGIAAIGGKDSMSGSFKDMDVPPTLVSFAVACVDARRVISPEFKEPGHAVIWLPVPRTADGMPDWPALRANYAAVERAIAEGRLVAAAVVREGGPLAALSRMAFGNAIGVDLADGLAAGDWFTRDVGGFVLELAAGTVADWPGARLLGQTLPDPLLRLGAREAALADLRAAWEQTLEAIFPTRTAPEELPLPAFRLHEPHLSRRAGVRFARPRVLIPVFPGTNCEYDSARAFEAAGAEVRVLVLRNQNHREIADSARELCAAIDAVQILMLAGGFSAGDEPGGSGKFIAAVFRNERVADATMRLIRERDGLILGICNGFQALVKLGLLPFGEIRPMADNSPSLLHNSLGRHVSAYVRTKVVSRLSPWLSACPLGAEYVLPVSHGEGRFVGCEKILQRLFEADMVASQYVDTHGRPTLDLPYNPNGSYHAIEGITSACGRIFGRMAHCERAGPMVGVNIPGEKYQPVFAGGVGYYR